VKLRGFRLETHFHPGDPPNTASISRAGKIGYGHHDVQFEFDISVLFN
jgi:hypothetical protein